MPERTKMKQSERAKQFAPFDALKGLQESLRKKEKEHEKNIKDLTINENIDDI